MLKEHGLRTGWRRRDALFAFGACLASRTTLAATDVEGFLRAGGCTVLLRHARTVPGTGDPPGFQLGQCSTQRNLSDAGRADSERIGRWFKTRRLQPLAVKSSAWCRCTDTAQLAFGQHTLWPALNSTFGDRLPQLDQTAALRLALGSVPMGRFEVWVTHQVNITALTGEVPVMGEAFIVDQQGKIGFRTTFA